MADNASTSGAVAGTPTGAPSAASGSDATKNAGAATTGTPPNKTAEAGTGKPGEVAEPKSEEPKFKVKVDGKEVEVPLSELQKHYGLDKSAQKRLQEAAKKEKDVNDILAKLKGDPDAYFKFVEQDPEDFAIKRLAAKHRKIQEEERIRQLSPEQREVEETKRELERLKGEREQAKAEQHTAKVGETKQRIVNAVISTLESFPEAYRKNDALALQVFATWEHAVENYEELAKTGVKLSPEYIRDQVIKSMRGLSGDFMANSADDEFDAMIPPKAMERIKAKIREELAAEATSNAHPSLRQEPQSRNKQDPKKQAPRLTSSQLLRRITLGHS